MTTTAPRTTDDPEARARAAEQRIEALRAEMDASADRGRQAILQYEIGHITETALANEPQAVREFLSAYNLDPQFRPPLIALLSIFERRRSTKNLARLYDAEARSATSPREAASALADRAVLMADQLGEAGEARQLLEAAFEQAAEAQDIALLLEHQLLIEGDRDAAFKVMAARAELVADPVLATLLRLEVARAKEDAGDVDGALSVLRAAVTTPAARWRVLEQLERVARRAGRHPERIVALEGRAKLAAAEARGEDQGQGSGAFSVQRFTDQARAAAAAAAIYRDAGRARIAHLADAPGARRDYDAALELRPDDPLLHHERMIACELEGDLESASKEARYLLDAGVSGPPAAALHFRLAENAQASGDAAAALGHMRDALGADPGSAVAAAMLDDLLRGSGDVAAAIDQLAARAEAAEGESRSQRYWEAAQLASEVPDAERAKTLYESAAAAAADPIPILREMYGAALRLGDAPAARTAAEALLDKEIEDVERSALMRDLHELLRIVLEDEAAADAVLDRALASKAAAGWAPDLARLHGALRGNGALAAKAHLALAERAADAETAAAHLCAAARMQMRSQDTDGAVTTLRNALARSPSHPYAVSLLEEVLRARGDAGELVRLLKEAAEASDAPRAAEARLLLAGAAAEAAEDLDKAIQTYEEAADRDPTSLAPSLALKRLAENKGDRELVLRALEVLSEREITNGAPGRHTLALGEHYDLISRQPSLAEPPLRKALASEPVALHAAVDLALLPPANGDPSARLAGLARVLEKSGDDARVGILREIAGAAIATDPSAAEEKIRELRQRAPRDAWTPFAWMRVLARKTGEERAPTDRADAWLALGHATDDPEAAGDILLHGLRSTAIAKGEAGLDDGVILAHEVVAVAPDSLASSVALDETLSAGDDPEGRADALSKWLEHAGSAGKLALEAARGRALGAAGRAREATEVLLRVAAAEADDLASWEAARVAARDAQAWPVVVEACDRLAHLIEDKELASMLLEESAAVLMDELKQDERAERRLRRVLAIDARRPIAYGRLHDLLADREDDAGLLQLVEARIELLDDPEELGKLYYEQARLLRGLGQRSEALDALDNLLMLDDEHVGGLALLVELQVQQENWGGAVEALRTLAAAGDVPDSQRRIARLGAADFLENKLSDLEGALGELIAIDEAGLADRPIYERTVQTAERLERWDAAVTALGKEAQIAGSPELVARLHRRAGAILVDRVDDREAAVDHYTQAIAAIPTDLAAAEALADLLDPLGKSDLSHRFEQSVRAGLEEDPTDPDDLRKLRRAAAWREDQGLDAVVLSTLVALGVAEEEERSAFQDHTQLFARPMAGGSLDNESFHALRVPGDGGAVLALAQLVSESVAEMDAHEPAALGFTKGNALRGEHPIRAEITVLHNLLGVAAPEVWQATQGGEPLRIDIMPYYKGHATFAVGTGVHTPLVLDHRFHVGRLAIGTRLVVAPFLRRDPMRAATALFAAAAAAEIPLPAGEGRAGMAETTRKLYKAMPRKVRKVVPEMVRALGDDGRSILAWSQLVHRTANRAGLLVSGDIGGALRLLIGEVSRENVLRSGDALDLLHFWLSPGALVLRQRLGLST
jgi:hypothetical protein